MLVWKGEGLPSDNLSMENALMIIKVISWNFRALSAFNSSRFQLTFINR